MLWKARTIMVIEKVSNRFVEQLSPVSANQSGFYLKDMDRLALKFHETHDLKVRDEIYRLC
jgi:hypothetical protein